MSKRAPLPLLTDHRILAPSETALALKLVSEMDLLRLKAIARLHARGLPPDAGWDDLLQEAITRVLTGTRQQPEGLPMVAFLAGVMRSLRADHIRRWKQGSESGDPRRIGSARDLAQQRELADPSPDPERALIAAQELAAIQQLFAGDTVALQIIAGLADGLSAEQIRTANDISRTDYDSARKRMRRSLLREGLTCERK